MAGPGRPVWHARTGSQPRRPRCPSSKGHLVEGADAVASAARRGSRGHRRVHLHQGRVPSTLVLASITTRWGGSAHAEAPKPAGRSRSERPGIVVVGADRAHVAEVEAYRPQHAHVLAWSDAGENQVSSSPPQRISSRMLFAIRSGSSLAPHRGQQRAPLRRPTRPGVPVGATFDAGDDPHGYVGDVVGEVVRRVDHLAPRRVDVGGVLRSGDCRAPWSRLP